MRSGGMFNVLTLVTRLGLVSSSSYTLNFGGQVGVGPLPVNLRLVRSYGIGELDQDTPLNITGPVLYPLTFSYGNGTCWHAACPHMCQFIPQIYPNIKTAPVQFKGLTGTTDLDNFYDFYEDPATGRTSCDAAAAPFYSQINGSIVFLSGNYFLACEREGKERGRGSCMFDTYEQAGALAIVLFWNLPAEMGMGIMCRGSDGNDVKNIPILFGNIWEEDFFGRGDFGPVCDGQLPPFAGDPRTDPPTPGLIPEFQDTYVDVNQQSLLYLSFGCNTGLVPGGSVVLTINNDGYEWTGNMCEGRWEHVMWFIIPGVLNVVLVFYSFYLIFQIKKLNLVTYIVVMQGILAPVQAAVREFLGPLWVCKTRLDLNAAIWFSAGDGNAANVGTVASCLIWAKMVFVRNPPRWLDPMIGAVSSLFLIAYFPTLSSTISGDVSDSSYVMVTGYFTMCILPVYLLVSIAALVKILQAGKQSGNANIVKLGRAFKWVFLQIVFMGVSLSWMINIGIRSLMSERLVKPHEVWYGWGFTNDFTGFIIAFSTIMFFATTTATSTSSSSSSSSSSS